MKKIIFIFIFIFLKIQSAAMNKEEISILLKIIIENIIQINGMDLSYINLETLEIQNDPKEDTLNELIILKEKIERLYQMIENSYIYTLNISKYSKEFKEEEIQQKIYKIVLEMIFFKKYAYEKLAELNTQEKIEEREAKIKNFEAEIENRKNILTDLKENLKVNQEEEEIYENLLKNEIIENIENNYNNIYSTYKSKIKEIKEIKIIFEKEEIEKIKKLKEVKKKQKEFEESIEKKTKDSKKINISNEKETIKNLKEVKNLFLEELQLAEKNKIEEISKIEEIKKEIEEDKKNIDFIFSKNKIENPLNEIEEKLDKVNKEIEAQTQIIKDRTEELLNKNNINRIDKNSNYSVNINLKEDNREESLAEDNDSFSSLGNEFSESDFIQ